MIVTICQMLYAVHLPQFSQQPVLEGGTIGLILQAGKLRLGEGTSGEQLDLNPGLPDSHAQALLAVPQLPWALPMSSKAAEVLPREGELSPEVVVGWGVQWAVQSLGGGVSVGRTGRSWP